MSEFGGLWNTAITQQAPKVSRVLGMLKLDTVRKKKKSQAVCYERRSAVTWIAAVCLVCEEEAGNGFQLRNLALFLILDSHLHWNATPSVSEAVWIAVGVAKIVYRFWALVILPETGKVEIAYCFQVLAILPESGKL